MNSAPRVIVKLIAALFIGIADAVAGGNVPVLTQKEVILLANAEAVKEGYDLREYEKPVVTKFGKFRRDTWIINYEIKPKNGTVPIGGHFSVWVNDKTK